MTTTGNPPADVQQYGQSIWYDNISRDMIRSGELQRLLDEYGVVGMTSNPTIFEKAIGEGQFYDDAIHNLLDLDANEIFDQLAIDDIRAAADLLRPIYDRTKGLDGYVSLEVSPMLANDTETTLSEAKRLFKAVERPNVMIKIPGTPAGLPAIEEALYEGVNINVTLLFSVENYVQVAERYISALERRLEAGLPVSQIASVASFFLSRIDTLVDKQLENNIRAAQGRDLDRVSANRQLLGKAAIANAKVAYKRFKYLFYGDRFAKLREAGAMVQRPLWASTGTKNPAYPDTLYLDSLIGKDTVNTVPQATLFAFKDHGTAAPTLDYGLDEAQELLDKLTEVGIDLDRITQQLQDDGVDLFIDSFKKLINRVEGKRKTLLSGFMQRQDVVLGQYQDAVAKEIKRLRTQLSITRTWNHDATLWKESADHVKVISNRLGWLTIANDGRIDRAKLRDLRDEAKKLGWTHVVLLGMGGSSLAPEVLARTFGKQAGFPELIVLDSTDPETILGVEKTADLDKTVFVVASKSGTTIETLSMQRYFYQKYQEAGKKAGEHFIAITDPGSKLEGWAKELGFRHTFLNPEDIGGRYAALSYFGMVPAALLGLDFERIMDAGAEMQVACSQGVTGNNHPGLWLGAVIGVLWREGRDKLTILASEDFGSFGDWAEQLVAESTGKEGKGIVPITGASVGLPHDYSDDRMFVYLRLDDSEANPDAEVRALQEAGHPVVTLRLRDKFDIGAEFFRWEFATAVAGMILQVNPFDEPNVTESKNNTLRLLEFYEKEGRLPQELPILHEEGVSLYADAATGKLLHDLAVQQSFDSTQLASLLAAFFTLVRSGDYFALLAYLQQSPFNEAALETIRRRLRHTFSRAVTLGFGPRFLHSTGQLHKGGANNGIFVQITVSDHADPAIPQANYGFSTLKQAQAAGDWQALQSKGRRVVRLHIENDTHSGLATLAKAVEAAAAKRF
ncbi:MAG: bifunctional transaldolase/phosoglucose isomerase [Anaerolineae bacterium]|nr:bifunctional transaldolase/phosoglucose isomerase [Anaerolineae bacterium]